MSDFTLERPARPVLLLCATLMLAAAATSAEARTRNFCPYPPYYSGKAVTCGGHLDPICVMTELDLDS